MQRLGSKSHDAFATIETQTPDRIRGRGVTAAQQTFNLHGGGSNPSGLICRCERIGDFGLRDEEARSREWIG